MATSLNNLQTLVRLYANNASEDITTAGNLILANMVYLKLCKDRRWPELTVTDTSIVMQNMQEFYPWPTSYIWREEPEVSWLNVKSYQTATTVSVISASGQKVLSVGSVQYTQPNDMLVINPGVAGSAEQGMVVSVDPVLKQVTLLANLTYTHQVGETVQPAKGEPYPLDPANTEREWMALGLLITGWPQQYRRILQGGQLMLALRPVPYITGNLVVIRGKVQPQPFTTGASTTVFIEDSSDNALAMLIAAFLKARRGEDTRAQALTAMAESLLPEYDYNTQRATGSVAAWGLPVSWQRIRRP